LRIHYEKSGGLPGDGASPCARTSRSGAAGSAHIGCDSELLQNMDYFDAYLRYWEQYHLSVASTVVGQPEFAGRRFR